MNQFSDLYKLLGVDVNASAEQLRKAFRKESLKCHPDKNPDDKDAVDRFYALKEAFDLLSAPDKRAAYDSKRESALKQQERFASLNGKRQADLADLHAREEAFKRQKTADRDARVELERIKEVNARMMKERMAHQASAPSPAPRTGAADLSRPSTTNGRLGEHDTKISLKWPSSIDRAVLTDSAALEVHMSKLYGEVISCAILPKRKAIVEFARLSSAVKAVDDLRRQGTALEGVAVTWLFGEPATVSAARARGATRPTSQPSSASATATLQQPINEDAVLAKMREQQKRKAQERARLEAEILAQDAEDELKA